jgi:thiol-disulfide isomerase/thioredoxin
MKLVKVLAFGLGILATATSFAQSKLDIGDPAPALTVTDWVKGTPTKEFVKGQVYVVEFWATWCGPCIESIPHVTKLARQYGSKVNFIGVSIMEKDESIYKVNVPAFVKKMGEKMDYNIATEGPGKAMETHWMKASGQEAIPCAFIVGGDGNILWIGHPRSNLEKTLDEVVAGKYDLKAAIAEKEAFDRDLAATKAMYASLEAAKKAKQWDKALQIISDEIRIHPMMEQGLGINRIDIMCLADMPDTGTYMKTFAGKYGQKNPAVLNRILWSAVEEKRKFHAKSKKEMAEIATELEKLMPNDAGILDTVSLAFYRIGNKARAIQIQKKAISIAESATKVDFALLGDLKTRLKMYQG